MYPTIDGSGWTLDQSEPIGTRLKDWLISPDAEGARWLVKWNRIPKKGPPPGEDWSEKVATKIAELMGLPHAGVEFAVDADGRLRVRSRSFVPDPKRADTCPATWSRRRRACWKRARTSGQWIAFGGDDAERVVADPVLLDPRGVEHLTDRAAHVGQVPRD